MASFLQRMILMALILTIAIPISIGHREKSENESDGGDDYEPESDGRDDSGNERDGGDDSEIVRYLRDLCSDTKKSKQCWKIIKPEITRFTDTDSKNVAGVVIELAIEKSGEINDKLNQLHHDSGDDALKEKYKSCSKNYNDANHNLESVKGNLYSSDCQGIPAQVDNVEQELKSCKHEFNKKSVDPAHVKDKNKEFGHYVEIVRAATNRVPREKDSNNDRKTQSN